ncbi:unnamed protein product [Pleuronectes platessa]|uniref:Uncharacterized protein n=1 Tax=Pleuronectes platessa TaxID=8262 RepID=A0A9N7U760_PLEPL|nr:unnamed protein product [Pleuronectes platessa]
MSGVSLFLNFLVVYGLESNRGRGWLVTAAGRDTPASNSTNHHCYISLVVSSLRRPIIPSSMDACVPHCSALRPPTCQDLQASLHPASPAFSCLVSNKLCSIPINYHSVSASGGQLGVQHLAHVHFGMQMGKTGDRTADLQVGGRPLYPSAKAAPKRGAFCAYY